MLVLMFISFYTSRIVLNALGVVDYGIYGVVGGIVGFLAFLKNSMTIATNRYFSFAIGRNDIELLNKTYSMCIIIHFAIGLILVILAETVGLWYFYHYLNIPADSYGAALFVYHVSIATTFISILMVPFTSMIISHEDMGVFAYISLLEGALKLGVAFLLLTFLSHRLIIYSILSFGAYLIVSVTWWIYSRYKYRYCRFSILWDKPLFKEMFGYINWQFLGSLIWVLKVQGAGLVLNYFFGPILNAARSIAEQVNAGVSSLVSNFETASTPQIIKLYSAGDLTGMHNLVFSISKLSFILLYIFALPILSVTEPLLKFWLKLIPDYAVVFVQLAIISALVYSLSGTLTRAALATSNIKKYQLVTAPILIWDVVFIYLAFKMGCPPMALYWVEISLYFITFFAKLFLLKGMINFPVKSFFIQVFLKEMLVVIVSVIAIFFIKKLFGETLGDIIILLLVSFLVAIITSLFLCLNANERNKFYSTIKSKLSR